MDKFGFDPWFENNYSTNIITCESEIDFGMNYRNSFRIQFNTQTGHGRFNYFDRIRKTPFLFEQSIFDIWSSHEL